MTDALRPPDVEAVPSRLSVARFFVENRQVSWVLLVGVIAWGIWAYAAMPKRKDPDIPVRQVAVVTPWPGQSAERVEQLVTRKIEERVAQNIRVSEITSTTRSGLSVVYAEVDENARIDTGKEFDDIKVKLDALTDLPEGAGPIQYIKEFGETSALMLTVASPPASGARLQLLAEQIAAATVSTSETINVVLCSSGSPDPSFVREAAALLGDGLVRRGLGTDVRTIDGDSFVVIVLSTRDDPRALGRAVRQVWEELPQRADIHPDVWDPIVVTAGVSLIQALEREAGPKYSYRELDDFTDRIEKAIKIAPEASRVTRVGVIEEQIEARYSQNRLAAFGIIPAAVSGVLQSRNTTLPAGAVNAEGRELALEQTSEFRTLADIDKVVFTQAANGTPLYLRDIGSVHRGYQHPPKLLSYYTWRDEAGRWLRGRAITLSVEMKKGEQINRFGTAVHSRVEDIRRSLPTDLVIGITSDQQRQVHEKLDLFNRSLWEAVFLVVLVSFVGFWEWRSALLMALSIPITLAMTFGLMQLVGLDIQQMSIASLIIALGLLVDDPVVAGDAIKRELAQGTSRATAAWLGPEKLSRAILYATITNIAAYLPFLLLNGDVGRYIYSLPMTIACSLVASRIMSMSFLPLLAYYILKPEMNSDARRARDSRFGTIYERAVTFAIDNRWRVLAASSIVLTAGAFFVTQLHRQFFPRDDFYIAYVDIRLPEDAPIAQTVRVAREADQIIREVTDDHDRGRGANASLASITSFVGAGGPRFWFSVRPEPPAPNYAQLLVQFTRSEDTNRMVGPLQEALSSRVAGARIDVRTVETGPPTIIPVSMRIIGDDARVLREEGEKLQAVLRRSAFAINVRDDWGNDAIRTRLEIDQDRAGVAGVSSRDIAVSVYSGVMGAPIGYLREGRKNIPIVQLMDYDQRQTVTDLSQLYVYSSQAPVRFTLGQIARLTYSPEVAVIHRVNQYRAINVAALPVPGRLADEVTSPLMPRIRDFERQLPAGYRFEIVGELKEQLKGQRRSLTVVIASVIAIYLALVFQFKNAVKPFIVFAGIPFGAVGAFASLWLTGRPMGFLAILGITSLIGVIVSHVIVLFDFIEEQHALGAPLRDALIDAGIRRIRPVLITVGATVLALFPLALHGGPLWEALCYAQIGGLTLATGVTLFLVPVFYAVFVLDLKVVQWYR
ncbi:MAG TPA: efflux RND transporter permease subunit [Vicinamibacterales bacterium]|nr:efflux RND transporter permease subunit [Vicinamibacterales bacterium]